VILEHDLDRHAHAHVVGIDVDDVGREPHVGLLVERCVPGDLARAEKLVALLENLTTSVALAALDLWPLSCRARLAAAVGDATTYTRVVRRYLELAEELDARGHIAIARQFATDPSFAAATP